jgi:hypothetical protein
VTFHVDLDEAVLANLQIVKTPYFTPIVKPPRRRKGDVLRKWRVGC